MYLDQLIALKISNYSYLTYPPRDVVQKGAMAARQFSHQIKDDHTPWSRRRLALFGPQMNKVFAAVLLGGTVA